MEKTLAAGGWFTLGRNFLQQVEAVEDVGEGSAEERRLGGMPKLLLPRKPLPPNLIEAHGVKRCSVCLQTFDADSKPSISVAFEKHVLEVHRDREGLERRPAKPKAGRAG
jgi:hypothetical protein